MVLLSNDSVRHYDNLVCHSFMTATRPTAVVHSHYVKHPRAERPHETSSNHCGTSARLCWAGPQMHSLNHGRPLDNKLLGALPRAQFEGLVPHLLPISLPQGSVLFETGDEVDQIYFPHFGMLSMLAVMRDGRAIE